MSSLFDQNTPYAPPGGPVGPPNTPKHRPRRRGIIIFWVIFAAVMVLIVAAVFSGPTDTATTPLQTPGPAATAVQDGTRGTPSVAEAEKEFKDAVAAVESLAPPLIKAPKGVTVSGDYADVLQVRSFKASRNVFEWMDITLRVKNLSPEDLTFVSVKVVALQGETVIATADGIIETIDSGQTITTELTSTDEFPTHPKGITYELEVE